MSSPRSMMALLAVLALSAKMTESAIAAPDLCTEADLTKGFCLDCKKKATCVTAGSTPDPAGECTIAGEACTVLAGIATCRPIAETECSCDKASQCDAYNPDAVLICLTGGMTIIDDCAPDSQTCVDGACATPASTESTVSPDEVCVGAPEGFVVVKPTCTTAAYCSGDGAPLGTVDCDSGAYFDVAEMGCMPLPPVPCAGCTGACPDKSDCSKWYICNGGAVLDEETCVDPTPDFDIDTNACVATETGTCTGNAGCTYGLTTITDTTATSSDGGSTDDGGSTGAGSDSTGAGTGSTGGGTGSTGGGSDTTTIGTGATGDSTTTTSRPAECTAANEGQRYPYEGNCKMYWSCVKVGNGDYAYVASTCLGDYVFNPATGFCDAQQNVPDCVPPQ